MLSLAPTTEVSSSSAIHSTSDRADEEEPTMMMTAQEEVEAEEEKEATPRDSSGCVNKVSLVLICLAVASAAIALARIHPSL